MVLRPRRTHPVYHVIIPNDSTSYHDIDQREAELDTAKNSYEKIKSARRLLRTGYPEIVALDVYNQDVKGLFSKRIDSKALNEEIGQAMASGFGKIKDDIDESIEKINNDDVPLETLSYVLDEVRKDPKYSELQDEINEWIDGEQSKDKWIKIGTAGLATVAGLGSLAFGGLPGMVLAGIGTGVGAGGAIYNLERSVDLFDIAQSQRVGEQLSQATYEEAKFDMVMGGVDLALSGIDAVSVVKSWKGMSKVTDASTLMEKGEDAAHLARAEKPIAKAVEEPKNAEIEAQKANMAEKLANKPGKEYDAIKNIDGPKTTKLAQAEELLNRASAAEPKVTKDLGDLAKATGGKQEGLDYRLKTKESLARKLETTNPENINDSLRYTITYPSENIGAGANKVMKQLEDAGYT